ncbi:MAG: hypothetical protein HY430_04100 [Candidatus Levybacteria bacterium]|nr:hypothetical protein [Candidatus Levybacteria bacterium]
MKKFLKILGGFIVLVVVVLLLIGGYFGFVPGVSAVFGSDKPKDLGVKYSQEDYESAVEKTAIDFGYKPSTGTPNNSIKFEGKIDINKSLTSAELTALLANDEWEYNFLRDTQIKINDDGTEEISGVLILDRIPGFLIARGYPEDLVHAMRDSVKYVPTDPTFYIKLDAGWENDTLQMNLQKAEFGRWPVDESFLKEYNSVITAVVQRHVLSVPNLHIDSLQFENGQMQYIGSFPEKIIWAK